MNKKTKTIIAIASLVVISTTLSGCDKIFKKSETTDSGASTVTTRQESDMYSGDFAVTTPQISSQGLGSIAAGSKSSKLDLLSLNNTEGHSAFLRYVITISTSGNNGYLDASVFDLAGQDNIKKLYMVNGGKLILADEYKASEHGDVIGARFIVDVGEIEAPKDKPAYKITNLSVKASDAISSDYTDSSETVISIRTQVSAIGGDTDEWVTVDEYSIGSSDPDGEAIDAQSAVENFFIPDIVLEPTDDPSAPVSVPSVEPDIFEVPQSTPEDVPVAETTVPVQEETQIEQTLPPVETTAETVITTEATATAETTTASTDIAPTSLSLNTGYVELETGGTYTLQATFEPSNATQTSLTWASANPAVATVSNGVVTAVGEGSTTVSCTTVNGMTLQVSVVVKAAQTAPVSNEITAIKFNTSEVRLGVGETYTLSISVEPSNITELNATWSNADPSVATVDGSGTITAVGEGTTTITLTADNGTNAYCNIIVE